MSIRTATSGLLTLGILGLTIGAIAMDATAGPTSRKMEKQIGLFERVVDDMLVESPNWLVRSNRNSRGSYVEGHGLIVTFDASLVNWDMDYGHGWKFWKHGKHGKHDDKRVIIIDEDDWDDADTEDIRRNLDDRGERAYENELKRGERLYKRGKAELVEVVLDFGEYLSEMQDSDVIEIEAFLGNAAYFIENDLSTLVMKVTMGDVREFSDGRITEEQLVQRIETEES